MHLVLIPHYLHITPAEFEQYDFVRQMRVRRYLMLFLAEHISRRLP